MTNLANGLYRLAEWITRFAYVNFLWIIFTICGLVVFGLLPATASMFTVIRKWVLGEQDIKIFKTFFESYRKEFLKANIIGYILVIIGYILSIEFKILRASDQLIYFVGSYGVIALFILYFIVLIYFFPIFVHFNLKLSEYFKWPFMIGIIHPILTLFLIVVISGLYYVAIQNLPILLFFFGGSVTAWILTWGISQTFPKFEKTIM